MIFGSFSEGQHVVAGRDIHGALGPLGYPAVKKGTRGIIRALPGWLSSRYTVEFASGGTRTVPGRDLRPALYGHGDEAWRRYKANRVGVRIGLFVMFGLPATIALLRYYMGGGTTAELVAALPQALLAELMSLVAAVGLPMFLLVVCAVWLWRRARS